MNPFSKLWIGGRLSAAFTAIVALTIASAVFSQFYLARVKARAAELTTVQAERAALAFRWRQNIVLNSGQSIILGITSNPDVVGPAQAKFRAISEETTELKKRFEEIETTGEGKALLAKLAEARLQYLVLRDSVSHAHPAEASDTLSATRLSAIKDFQKVGDDYAQIADSIVAYEQHRGQADGDDIRDAVHAAELAGVLCAVVSVLASIGLSILVTRSIVGPLRAAQQAADRIASGDLRGAVVLTGKDETGQLASALLKMQDALKRIVDEIRTSTESIQVASSQVASGNHDLSVRTEETAGSLQQTASSMEQLTSAMRSSADAAAVANGMATSASQIAIRGGGAVSEVVATMNEINMSSKKIADIISVIDGIAFQTNILALNAAVEAARAGEQGRGFAVVAGEVRTLAHRSADAAKEIKALIEASVQKVEAGVRLVEGAGITIDEVVAAVKRVGDTIAGIKTLAGEQALGIEQVNTAVSELDRVTQQNAALVEESAAAAESMREQASKLSRVVEQFNT